MSAARCRFLLESVADLRARLRERGSDLLVRRGHPEDVIPALAARLRGGAADAVTLFAHTDVCSEEANVHAAVKSALAAASSAGSGGGAAVAVKEVWGNTLHDVADLPFNFPSGVPEVFTQVRRRRRRTGNSVSHFRLRRAFVADYIAWSLDPVEITLVTASPDQ